MDSAKAGKNHFFLTMFLWLLCIFAASSSFAAEVSDPRAERDGDVMVFSYDLTGKGATEIIGLSVKVGGTAYSAKKLHLQGDVGKVQVGKGKQIRWDIRQDFPGGVSEDPAWEIFVDMKGFRDPITGMEFVFVKGGCYQMGDPSGKGSKDELPAHEVCVDDFYIGKYEVTQGEWQRVMGANPAVAKQCGPRCPVENVSWKDAELYLKKWNNSGGRSYRLPSEAEWEYAARSGGRKEQWAGAAKEKDLKKYAVVAVGGETASRPVGRKKPNGLGIYDMTGNVWEWVSDFYGKYTAGPRNVNPQGPPEGLSRVQRGGAWNSNSFDARTTRRVRGKEGTGSSNVGFRVVLPGTRIE